MGESQFDQLPDLCMRSIFRFLNLPSLANCRAVNHQFKFYAEQVGTDELVLNDCGRLRKGAKWWLTDRPIDSENSISLKAFIKSVRSSPFKLHQQLKFLHIQLKHAGLDFKILNDFKQLVHLEVKLGTLESRESGALARPKTLNHPSLRVFQVCSYKFPSYILTETPNLEVLGCNEMTSIQVEHPATIKRLVCGSSGDNTLLAKFKNLEILECESSNGIRLSDWKRLKELCVGLPTYFANTAAREAFKSSIVNIMRQKTVLKREELKFYLGEVLLVDVKQLDGVSLPFDYFWFKNYKLLRSDHYSSITELDFNFLMKLDVEISADFFVRFPAIEFLTASGLVDQDDFEWFLKNAKAVRCLTLTNTSLDQPFMEQLSKLNDKLTHLEIDESPELVTSFNFILQFEQLQVFETGQQLGSLDLAESAFRRLKDIVIFRSRVGDEFVEINRFSKVKNDYTLNFYSISDNRRSTQKFHQENLRWSDLATLYDQRKAAGAKSRAKIKRS